MNSILLAGFTSFGQDDVNPASKVAHALDGIHVGGYIVIGRELPVVRGKCLDLLKSFISESQPRMIVLVGQAAGRAAITPERVAINVDDFRFVDSAGAQPRDEPVVPGGPVGYWSTLPLNDMVRAIQRGGIPVEISNTAGTYVCNHAFYGLMHHLASAEDSQRLGGFVHVPVLPEQVIDKHPGVPSMSLETIARGLTLGLQAAVASVAAREETHSR